jgi:hypothetical protein
MIRGDFSEFSMSHTVLCEFAASRPIGEGSGRHMSVTESHHVSTIPNLFVCPSTCENAIECHSLSESFCS